MSTTKPYKAKSLKGAQSKVRQLQRQIFERDDLLRRFDNQRRLLAKLASDTPQFFNPLEVMAAKKLRDEILAKP